MRELVTSTGRRVNPLKPRLAAISLDDIAWQLAATCRWSGACRPFYSVAEHSVAVSRAIERETGNTAWAMAGLLHDAPEYVLGDVVTPLKRRTQLWVDGDGPAGLRDFHDVEVKLLAAICVTVGFDSPWTSEQMEAVGVADDRQAVTEARDLFPVGVFRPGDLPAIEPYPERISPLRDPERANAEFFRRFVELKQHWNRFAGWVPK